MVSFIIYKLCIMKPKLFLRIASVLIFVHAIGHSFGHLGWKKAHDPVQQEVISQMTEHKFAFMGKTRSMGEYFDGYGYACSLALFLIGTILWIVSADNSASSKKIILAVSICLAGWGTDELVWFCPAAAIMTLIAALLSLLAFFNMRTKAAA
jgi:hypothetical protein